MTSLATSVSNDPLARAPLRVLNAIRAHSTHETYNVALQQRY